MVLKRSLDILFGLKHKVNSRRYLNFTDITSNLESPSPKHREGKVSNLTAQFSSFTEFLFSTAYSNIKIHCISRIMTCFIHYSLQETPGHSPTSPISQNF